MLEYLYSHHRISIRLLHILQVDPHNILYNKNILDVLHSFDIEHFDHKYWLYMRLLAELL